MQSGCPNRRTDAKFRLNRWKCSAQKDLSGVPGGFRVPQWPQIVQKTLCQRGICSFLAEHTTSGSRDLPRWNDASPENLMLELARFKRT